MIIIEAKKCKALKGSIVVETPSGWFHLADKRFISKPKGMKNVESQGFNGRIPGEKYLGTIYLGFEKYSIDRFAAYYYDLRTERVTQVKFNTFYSGQRLMFCGYKAVILSSDLVAYFNIDWVISTYSAGNLEDFDWGGFCYNGVRTSYPTPYGMFLSEMEGVGRFYHLQNIVKHKLAPPGAYALKDGSIACKLGAHWVATKIQHKR